ncbi:MAG: hypothetical protein ACC658_06535 [Acidimicrobiia bacterium]
MVQVHVGPPAASPCSARGTSSFLTVSAVISELGSNTSSFLDNERKKKLLTEIDMALAEN